MLLSVSFRIFVVSSVFSEKFSTSLAIAAIQPLVLGVALTPVDRLLSILAASPSAWLGGSVTIIAVILYIRAMNSSGSRSLDVPPLRLLKHFLLAWAEGEVSELEEDLERFGSRTTVRTFLLQFKSVKGVCQIIVPEVHPGPFYAVGSSNLPSDLHAHFSKQGIASLVVHGISGHGKNLPSKSQLIAYMESLASAEIVERAEQYVGPTRAVVGKAIVSGIGFGSVAVLTITLSPYGMEDFPGEVRTEIERFGSELGWEHTVVIDSHNSEGSPPSPEESKDVVNAARLVLEKLRSIHASHFMMGFAHSSELNLQFGQDVGPGGVGVLVISAEGGRWALVTFDANNAVRHLRERLIDTLAQDGVSTIDVCTSDTHFTAARSLGEKGYLALGELTGLQDLEKKVRTLMAEAMQGLSEAKVEVRLAVSTVTAMSESLIETFSRTLDQTLSVAKRGGLAVLLVSATSLLANILLSL